MENQQETYLHGYDLSEQNRLLDQGRFLAPQVFEGVDFSACESCLEIGSGTGAQTRLLLEKFPELKITCVEREKKQIEFARSHLNEKKVTWVQADAQKMPFHGEQFDSAFICWLLEHVPSPLEVIQEAHRVLRPGSPIVVNEVFNNALYVYPSSPFLKKYWQAYNDKQIAEKGHPFIGAQVPSLLAQVGFKRIEARHQLLWADARDPLYKEVLVDYFQNLIFSAKELLHKDGRITAQDQTQVALELEQIKKRSDGVFHFYWCQTMAYK